MSFNKTSIFVVIGTIILVGVSFFAGYLFGEKRLAKTLKEEARQLEIITNQQTEELEDLRQDRNYTLPDDPVVNKQKNELNKLREEAKED